MKVEIRNMDDIITSRSAAKEMAREMGFGIVDQTKIATAISELARNVIDYAGAGMLSMRMIEENRKKGMEIICEDQGPGIDDIARAMQDGFSTAKGLGMGLPGAKRLMDEFDITSARGKGTRIMAIKWLW